MGFESNPVQPSPDGRSACQFADNFVSSGKIQHGKTQQHGQNSLTGKKKHSKTGQQKKDAKEITNQEENEPGDHTPKTVTYVGPWAPSKIIHRQEFDQPRNQRNTENERDKG